MAVSAYEIQNFNVCSAFVPREKAGYMKAQGKQQLSDDIEFIKQFLVEETKVESILPKQSRDQLNNTS
jgi:hypothetical protein